MFGWNSMVSGLAALLCILSQAYGGSLGMAILTISVIVRLALLPITLRMARHAQAQQKLLHKLKDEIAALRRKYKSNPQRLAAEMANLYRRHGVKPVDGGNLAGSLVNVLVGAGLYSAIRRNVCPGGRFLWIRNLVHPDAFLIVLTGAITFISSLIGPHLPEQSRFLAGVIPAVMTVVVAWRLSSAVVLYWAASSAINCLQGLILRRTATAQ